MRNPTFLALLLVTVGCVEDAGKQDEAAASLCDEVCLAKAAGDGCGHLESEVGDCQQVCDLLEASLETQCVVPAAESWQCLADADWVCEAGGEASLADPSACAAEVAAFEACSGVSDGHTGGDSGGDGGTDGDADNDGDGHPASSDCNDNDASVYPGAPELCDEVDNDCDSVVDDNPPDGEGVLAYLDVDGDGVGNDDDTEWVCEVRTGYSEVGGDCVDTDRDIFPGANELCDGADNDCDGEVDEEPFDGTTQFVDVDGDGFGLDGTDTVVCPGVEGFADEGGDCDDDDEDAFPGSAELESETDCLRDADGDGWGDADAVGFPGTDCDDTDPDLFPGAAPEDSEDACLRDLDGDGWGDALADFPGTDCDDSDEFTFPGAAPEDSEEDCLTDADLDGFGDEAGLYPGTDCDDADAAIHPHAEEVCDDLVDDDCDGDLDDLDVCLEAEGCRDIFDAGLPDGTYDVEPPSYGSTITVNCEGGYTEVTSAMVVANPSWMTFSESVSNLATWSTSTHTGMTTDGFWVETARNFSLNGYSMCVQIELQVPWYFDEMYGEWTADAYANGGPDDNDGLDWNQAANALGYGHLMFGAYHGGSTFDTSKSAGTWGQDWDDYGAQTHTFSAMSLSADTQTIVWEYCDDGLRGEDIEVYDLSIFIYDVVP